MSLFSRIFRRRKTPTTPRLELFKVAAKNEGFSVEFSREVARVIRYRDSQGVLEFTVDLGSKGNHSIAIDPPSTCAPSARVEIAVARTKRFLEASGFEVELPL